MIPWLIGFLECSLSSHPSEQRKQGIQGKISSVFTLFFDALIVAQTVEEIKFEYNLVNEFKFSVLW